MSAPPPCPALFKDFLDHALDAAWIVDGEGRVLYANAAAAALLGGAPEALVGTRLSDVIRSGAGLAPGGSLRALLSGDGPSSALGRRRQVEVANASGQAIAVELAAFELSDDQGARRFGIMMADLRPRLELFQAQERIFERLSELALTDELTGLPNRRAFSDALVREIASLKRHGRVASVAVLDLDHFKQVNDRLGHAAGDEVLQSIAKVLADNLRGEDLVGRIGGEEFALLLPTATAPVAGQVVERLRARVGDTLIVLPDKQRLRVTVSAGVADLDPVAPPAESLSRADQAMYAAKATGRNRVVVYGPDGLRPADHAPAQVQRA